MDDFVIAMSRYRRRRYAQAVELCDKILAKHPLDQSAWVLKCKSIIGIQFLDDLEIFEEGLGDMLMDDNAINTVARPGTSILRPGTQSNQGVRPMTNGGRVMTGFARPVTSRLQTSNTVNALQTARQGQRVGTSRPLTQGGRYVRLGTASLQAVGGSFIQVDKLDLKSLAKKPVVSRVLCDYLIYVEHNPRKALEIAAEATALSNYNDWWWKERLGKCYFMLGLYRDAEKQLESSMKTQNMIQTVLQLARVYIKFDQPNAAIKLYEDGIQNFPQCISFIIGLARIYDLMNDPNKSIEFYRRTLAQESSNLEAVASIATYHFYIDQPEVSLKFYQRLIQLGVQTAEIWNNIALCCFFDQQYDLFYSCIERALMLADEQTKADIWYNISHVHSQLINIQIYLNLGDLGTAQKCLKLCISFDSDHAEAYNNCGIIEAKRGEIEKARTNYQLAMNCGAHLYEPPYNQAVLSYNNQDFQNSYQFVQKALENYPDHYDSKELKKKIEKTLQNL